MVFSGGCYAFHLVPDYDQRYVVTEGLSDTQKALGSYLATFANKQTSYPTIDTFYEDLKRFQVYPVGVVKR